MDRRQQSRVFVDLPVQIWGLDSYSRPFMQPASLRTISGRGATLQCVDARLKPGDTVEQATRVLNEAGLPNSVDRFNKARPRIQSVYRMRNGSGYSIYIYLDRDDRVTKIEFERFYTFL